MTEEPAKGAPRQDCGETYVHEGIIPDEALARNEAPFCPKCLSNVGKCWVMHR